MSEGKEISKNEYLLYSIFIFSVSVFFLLPLSHIIYEDAINNEYAFYRNTAPLLYGISIPPLIISVLTFILYLVTDDKKLSKVLKYNGRDDTEKVHKIAKQLITENKGVLDKLEKGVKMNKEGKS